MERKGRNAVKIQRLAPSGLLRRQRAFVAAARQRDDRARHNAVLLFFPDPFAAMTGRRRFRRNARGFALGAVTGRVAGLAFDQGVGACGRVSDFSSVCDSARRLAVMSANAHSNPSRTAPATPWSELKHFQARFGTVSKLFQ